MAANPTPQHPLTPHHIQTARNLAAEADAAFQAGQTSQGSQKLWDAAAHLITPLAQHHAWPHQTPNDLWEAAGLLSDEIGGEPDLWSQFGHAWNCRQNAQDNFLKPQEIERSRKAISSFIDHLEKLRNLSQ